MIRFLLGLLATVMASPAFAVDPLKCVPADAALFAHIDVAKAMKGTLGRSLRGLELPREQDDFDRKPDDKAKTYKPYPDFQAKFLKATGIDLDTIKTATMFMPKLKGPGDEQTLVLSLVLAKEYDQARLLKGLAELDEQYQNPKPIGIGMVEFGNNSVRLGFPDDKTIVIMGPQVKVLPTAVDNSKGVIAPAITAAANGSLGVLSLNFNNFPEEIKGDELPAELRPFAPLIKSELNYATFDQNGEMIQATIHARNQEKAKTMAAERSLEALMTFAKTGLAVAQTQLERNSKEPGMESVIGLVKSLQDTVKTARYETDDQEARLKLSMKADTSLTGTVASMVGSVRSAAGRSVTQNNLKQIGLAMHNYDSAHGHFPAAAICDKAGKPLLSWRVAILPYIEQDNLYKQFKLDEPWDSAHNIKLADYVVKVYTIPGQADVKKTHYRVFTGGNDPIGAAFDMKKPFKIVEFNDGTSNTIMTVLSKEAVVWTKPDELTLDMKKNPADLLLFQNNVTNVGFADGSVRAISKTVPADTWRSLLTRNGGEVVNP